MDDLLSMTDEELIHLQKTDPVAFAALYKAGYDAQITLAKKDVNAFNEFVLRDEKTQEPIKQAPYHRDLHEFLDEAQYAVVWGHVESGKLLDLDTEIPTTQGFKRLRDVKTGDFVIAMDGSPTRVVSETPPETPVTYTVRFSDGTECVAGADHQWLAWTADRFAKNKAPTVVTTQEMLDRGLFVGDQAKREYPARKWRVPIAAPVQYPHRDLPLDPYFVGAWLGDGTMARAEITGHVGDMSIATRCMMGVGAGVVRLIPGREHLYRCKFSTNTYQVLRSLGITEDKSIPAEYLMASVTQRLELLRGLMDTDGSISRTKRNWCEVSFANERLANDTIELVRSLGWRASLAQADSKCGDFIGKRWRVTWTADELCPFHLARKVAIWLPRARTRDTLTKTVVSIERTSPRPMKCLGVDHPSHTYLIGRHYTVTHNCVTASTLFIGYDTAPMTVEALRAQHERSGAWVWTVDYVHRAWRQVLVKDIFDNGLRSCIKVTTEDGQVSVVSENHPFLAGVRVGDRIITMWREARYLNENCYVFAPATHPAPSGSAAARTDGESFALGFILSLALNDASAEDLNGGMRFKFACTTLAKTYDIVRLARQVAELTGWAYDEHSLDEAGAVFSLTPGSYDLRDWLRERGVYVTYTQTNGAWSRDVKTSGPGGFPAWLWRADTAAITAFLKAYCAPRLGVLSGARHRPIVHVYVKPGDAPIIATLFRRIGVEVRTHAVKQHRVWGVTGTWALFVGDVLSYLGEGFSYMRTALPRARPYTPLTMKPVRVKRVEDAGVQQTWGIEIDDEQHTHVTDGILTHNTQQVTIGRTLRILGEDPGSRIVILQSSADVAKDTVSAIKSHIESNDRLHAVYPELKPGTLWTSNALIVQRPPGIRTPSVQARGAGGKVLGNRYTHVMVDDLLTLATTRTPYMRDQIKEWFLKEVMSRLLSDGCCWFMGNALHPKDLMHFLATLPAWKSRVYPVRDPITKVSNWPERWSDERINSYGLSRSAAEVARALDCIPRSDEDARFKADAIEASLARGRGIFGDNQFAFYIPPTYGPDVYVATGVDLAFTDTSRSDYTVLFTAAFHPDGMVDILDIQRGKWQQDDILDRMVATQRRYQSTLFVESVMAQIAFVNMLKTYDPNFPVYPHQTRGTGTTTNKWHRVYGLESLANEINRGMWRFPTSQEDGIPAPELLVFVNDLLDHVDGDHTADTVMAAWICLRGARDRGPFKYDLVTIATTPEQADADRLLGLLAPADGDAAAAARQEAEDLIMQRALQDMWSSIGGAGQ